MKSTKIVPVEADRKMIDAMIAVENKDGSFAEMYKAAVEAAPEPDGKPLYMYRRLGQASWVTCDKEQYDALSANHLFSVRVINDPYGGLQIFEGPMPESTGAQNYTALLYRDGDMTSGITLYRSEYPDRTRYEADRFRYMLGMIDKEPDITEYDPDKHSGYKKPKQWFTAEEVKAAYLAGSEPFVDSQSQKDADEYLKSIQE